MPMPMAHRVTCFSLEMPTNNRHFMHIVWDICAKFCVSIINPNFCHAENSALCRYLIKINAWIILYNCRNVIWNELMCQLAKRLYRLIARCPLRNCTFAKQHQRYYNFSNESVTQIGWATILICGHELARTHAFVMIIATASLTSAPKVFVFVCWV